VFCADDVGIEAKRDAWVRFYNFVRPNAGQIWRTRYVSFGDKLLSSARCPEGLSSLRMRLIRRNLRISMQRRGP